jgi:hypothetical protein
MANSRPESMIIPPGVFDETNTNNILKKDSIPINGHSSSSSVDSTSDKNINLKEKNSLPKKPLTITTSSTTTDSDFESEQDDHNLQLQQPKNGFNTEEHLPRRVRHFHKLFKSEIPDEMPDLIDSYVCAYQGDILLQGKMYITAPYLCFHSRIINYVTKHVYRWEQIDSIRKERVAFIFPTAICIQLKQTGKKVVYASFLQRDQAYAKIHSIWSQCTNNNHLYDDDDNDLIQDGTLKAINNEKLKYSNQETFTGCDESEQDVLQMCLKQNSRHISPMPRKNLNEKQSTKKLINSYEKKTSLKNSNQDPKLSIESNNTDQTSRRSRYTKHEQKLNETTKSKIFNIFLFNLLIFISNLGHSSKVNHRSQSTSQQNRSRDQTLSREDEILSHSNSSSTIIPTINSSISNSNSNGIFLTIIDTIISFLYQIKSYISSYPMKTSIIILLILTILFLHSFYLIKLAYRIENRLQSLHHLWPSSISAMKNSLSSNTKEL